MLHLSNCHGEWALLAMLTAQASVALVWLRASVSKGGK